MQRLLLDASDPLAVEHDLSGARHLDLRDDVEQRRFAGARGSDDGEELAGATENDMSWMIQGGGSRPARAGKRLPRFPDLRIGVPVIAQVP